MLRFNKGFNNNTDLKTDSKYDKFGRFTPSEIASRKFNEQMKQLNKNKQSKEQTIKQTNQKFDNLNGFKNLNRMK